MKILVFGAGAIGSVLGGLLGAHHEVTLVARAPHVRAIQRSGLRIDGVQTVHVDLLAETEVTGEEEPEFVLVTVKAFDTATAAEALRPALRPDTVIASVQNGLGNLETLRRVHPRHRVLAAATTEGAVLEGPGRVRWSGTGETRIGGAPADRPDAERLADAFRAAGLEAQAVEDIRGSLWLKAVVNAAINPLTALEGVPNGELLRRADLRDRMERVVEECVRVTRALGIALPADDAWDVVKRVAERTAQNRSSMLEGLRQGKRTEIDAITGAFLREAERLRLDLPENQSLYDAVRDRERLARFA